MSGDGSSDKPSVTAVGFEQPASGVIDTHKEQGEIGEKFAAFEAQVLQRLADFETASLKSQQATARGQKITMWATVVIAITTFAYALTSYFQLRSMNDTATDTHTLAVAAGEQAKGIRALAVETQRASHLSHRPLVLVTDLLETDWDRKAPELIVNIVNRGDTPAVNVFAGDMSVSSRANWTTAHITDTIKVSSVKLTAKEWADLKKTQTELAHRPTSRDMVTKTEDIGPVMTPGSVGYISVQARDIRAYGERDCPVVLHAELSYKDMFGEAHTTLVEYERACGETTFRPTNRNNKAD